MKKLALILMILAVLAPGMAPALAQPSEGAFALASYFPDDIDAYIGLRTGDQAIADVDAILAKTAAFASEFGATDIPSSVRDMFLQIDGLTATDIDTVLAWLGDGIAIGTDESPDQPENAMLVLQLDDRDAAEEFIASRLTDEFTRTGEEGGFTIYEGDGYLLFGDDILLAVSAATPEELAALISGDYPRLTARDGFAEAVAVLPDSSYTLGV